MDRPNYFELLGLDPEAATSESIQKAIDSKRNEWGRPHPTRGLEFEYYRSLIDGDEGIRSVMADPVKRAVEAQSFFAERDKKRREARASLEQRLRRMSGNGSIVEEDIERLARRSEYAPFFTVNDIRQMAERLGIKIGSPEAPPPIRPPRLDRATESQIRRGLDAVGKADLYDFLGLSLGVSCATLQQKATEMQEIARRNQNQTAYVKGQLELAGICSSIFRTEEQRARYDESLRLASLDEVLEEAKITVGVQKFLSAKGLDGLLSLAKEKGIVQKEAREAIIEYARSNGWTVEVPGEFTADLQQRCGRCRTMQPLQNERCMSCGMALKVKCPKCNTINSSEARFCTKCSFPTGDLPLVEQHVREARAKRQTNDLVGAKALLEKVFAVWPDHEEAKQELQQIERELVQLKTRLRGELDQRRFHAAQAVVNSLRQVGTPPSDLGDAVFRISGALEAAQKHCDEANHLLGLGLIEAASLEFSAALEACADHEAARKGLLEIERKRVIAMLRHAVAGDQDLEILQAFGDGAAFEGHEAVQTLLPRIEQARNRMTQVEALRKANLTDDDQTILSSIDLRLFGGKEDYYAKSFEKEWTRLGLAQQRIGALKTLRAALATDDDEQILAAWDHALLEPCKNLAEGERKRVADARENIRVSKALDKALGKGEDSLTLKIADQNRNARLSEELRQRVREAGQRQISQSDPSELAVELIGKTLQLRWAWPSGVNMVFIATRPDAYPESPRDPLASVVSISREEYDKRGLAEISSGGKAEYIQAFGGFNNGDDWIHSSGSHPTSRAYIGPRRTVRYHLLQRGLLKNSNSLEIRSDDGGALPDLILVAAEGHEPRWPEAGTTVAELRSASNNGEDHSLYVSFLSNELVGAPQSMKLAYRQGRATVPLDRAKLKKSVYIRLFPSPSSDAANIADVRPENGSELRVS